MQKKTVILAMPPIFDIYKVLAENLRFHGFEVVEIIYQEEKFVYKNIWQRLKKFYYRNVLNQREYKKEQLFKPYYPEIKKKLEQIQGKADYCFMIWPGVFPSSFMQILRDKSDKMVHYNWETLEFLEHEFYKIRYFDKFMFFDPNDIGKRPEYADKLVPITSFWFDCLPPQNQVSGSLFFIGSHHKERIHDIQQFYQAAKENQIPIDFHIAAKDVDLARQELGLADVHYFPMNEALPYRENLKKAQQAGILVDFLHSKHQGLSLRIFEAIGYDKKLITTNPTVVYYDFYHPDNMFVWTGNNIDELKIFLQKPYQPLPENLKHKYSFGNWIKYVFDIEPNIPITLPELPTK